MYYTDNVLLSTVSGMESANKVISRLFRCALTDRTFQLGCRSLSESLLMPRVIGFSQTTVMKSVELSPSERGRDELKPRCFI